MPTLITGVTVNERVTATGREVLAMIDVQDENDDGHAFGSHDVTVSDDRFYVSVNGATSRDSDSDGSTWELHAVRGTRFDYETDDMDPSTPGTQIELTITATDGGGLSTPAPNPAAGLFRDPAGGHGHEQPGLMTRTYPDRTTRQA